MWRPCDDSLAAGFQVLAAGTAPHALGDIIPFLDDDREHQTPGQRREWRLGEITWCVANTGSDPSLCVCLNSLPGGHRQSTDWKTEAATEAGRGQAGWLTGLSALHSPELCQPRGSRGGQSLRAEGWGRALERCHSEDCLRPRAPPGLATPCAQPPCGPRPPGLMKGSRE